MEENARRKKIRLDLNVRKEKKYCVKGGLANLY